MKVFMALVLASAVMDAEMLEMTVTGPASAIPGLTIIERIESDWESPEGRDLPSMPGWPIKVASDGMFAPARGVALADFDGDGSLEVIRGGTDGQLHVWRFDGTYYPGWPITLNNNQQYAPAVADVDLDGELEIGVTTRGWTSGGRCYLLGEDGSNEPGWPFVGSGNNFSDSPTFADLDGDDTLEIIVGERVYPNTHLHVLRYDGTEYPGAWPVVLDHIPAAGAGVADLNLDGVKEIVYLSYNSSYVLEPDGSILPGWPQTNPDGRNFSYQSPALADVDGDDTLEIAVAMHQNGGGCYLYRHNGTQVPGWPSSYPRWTYCPPTIADLYRDGDLKVLCGVSGVVSGGANVLYSYDDDASVLPGFPHYQATGDAAEGNITVVDLDEDGDMEIIFTSNKASASDTSGYLFACHHDGTPVSGWPLRTYGFTYLNGVTVADVDGDDSLDIVAVSDYEDLTQISIWEAGVPLTSGIWEWPTYQFDMARTGLYRAPDVGICGDANGDEGITPSDGFTVLNYFGSGPEPASCWAANAAGGSDLTPADAYSILNWIGSTGSLTCEPCEF
jgi:hypothetical protein